MMPLSREEFKKKVFQRDSSRCVICGNPAKDAHHIIDRSLWDDGGYHTENGVSLCEAHHMMAETTALSCGELRIRAHIENVKLPEHFYSDEEYDHWGNIIKPTGARIAGELFHKESVRRTIQKSGNLEDFIPYVKFPRTYHFEWSPNLQNDDRMLYDLSAIEGQEVVASIKMDGENCLSEETEIVTEIGIKTIKWICDNKYSGKVLTINMDTFKKEWCCIESWFVSKEKDLWLEIELENGTTIRTTENHYFWLPDLNCWRKAKDLKEEDFLYKDG